MLTLLHRVYVLAIKNTGQYTTEEKRKQMCVLEPQAFEFAILNAILKTLYVGLLYFVCVCNNAFLVSFKGFNMLQGYLERKEGEKWGKKAKG